MTDVKVPPGLMKYIVTKEDYDKAERKHDKIDVTRVSYSDYLGTLLIISEALAEAHGLTDVDIFFSCYKKNDQWCVKFCLGDIVDETIINNDKINAIRNMAHLVYLKQLQTKEEKA
jgi:hypothetical protein